MTRDETIGLWQRCEDVRAKALEAGRSEQEAQQSAAAIWNGWAQDLLNQRAEYERQGDWAVTVDYSEKARTAQRKGLNTLSSRWLDAASVNFSGYRFERAADFSNFIFPSDVKFGRRGLDKGYSATVFDGEADFQNAKFEGVCEFVRSVFRERTRFDGVKFLEYATFARAEFHEGVSFRHAAFQGIAYFAGTEFEDDAWFENAEFSNEARFYGAVFNFTLFEYANFQRGAAFDHAQFKKFAGFKGARFLEKPASFDGTLVDSSVAFNRTFFEKLPDFSQAVFKGAPRLDYMQYGDKLERDRFWPSIFGSRPTRADDIARYRALRALAIAAHDYENEAKAFKGEMRSKRGTEHKWWQAVFWVGVLYDTLSDFGRSIMRPLLFWLLSIPAFAVVYLANAEKLSSFSAVCPDNTAHWLKSLMFALKNAILFVQWDREQIRSAYACLYPQQPNQADLFVPVTNAFIQAAQSIWSATLIFLFLLAVRNQFKIK